MSRTIKSALPLLLGNICLLFLLLAGGLFAFTSAYGLTPDSPVLLAGCGCFSVLFACLWSVRRGGWAALGLLGLDAYAVWRLWEWLEPAANVIGMAVSGSGGQEPVEFSLMRSRAAETLTPALLLLAFALACVLGWLAVRERCWHLPAVIVTIPLLSALMSGVLPALTPLLATAAAWGTLLLTSLYNRKDSASLGRGLWMNLGGLSALLMMLLVLLPQEGYRRPDWATSARDNLIETVTRGFAQFWEGDGGSGESLWSLDFGVSTPPDNEIDGQVDLTQAGPRQYRHQTVLQVIGGEPGRTYLRGGSSAVYTGSTWEALNSDEEPYFSYAPEMFPALTAPDGTASETLTVKHIQSAGNTAYVPYRFLAFPDGLAYLYGSSGAERTIGEYQIEYIPGGPLAGAFTPLTGAAADAELAYRNFVYSHYLDVPEEARWALARLEEERESLSYDVSTTSLWPITLEGAYQERAYLARLTAKLLENVAVYDLNASLMEPGEDFVTHFLQEGRGYCVHFATTGTLFLRMLGVPARYVEGYTPLLGDSGISSVRDSDAHAWVEIYLDGYGWYPVEMTPGRQGGTSDTVAPEILQTETAPTPVVEDQPEEEQPVRTEDSQPETPPDSGAAESPDVPAGKEPSDLRWLWKAAIILLIPAALYGGYRLTLLLQKKRREHPDTNRSVIYAYLRYQRLLNWDGPEEPELEELGRKAKFSQHRLTEEERKAAWSCADHALAEWKQKKLRFHKTQSDKKEQQKKKSN